MESKKINQLATNVSPQTSDLTIIGDPTTGVSKKITLLQIANLFATTGTVSSVAVTETGEALTITGSPITTAGTINIGFAGGATQYVRGDGALADFPTSTGGGSSVSYYLNSSVSQGTIGGVAYRQLSKTPIAGAGTDITISASGYIASYITDANDPALLEVPAGNFNCEFYFSVNSDAHNPYVYAEFYKYDGTTFTLLGSSQSIPEYLSNGTTLSAYYFAMPIATAALTVTDRIAIRIYANVDTRIVTLHTENSHLCQVVTTFSKGLTTLNNLTRQNQFFATGTSGTDFNISSGTATHTFNIPDASASARGLITTGTQTIAGAKTFSSVATFTNNILINSLTIGRGAGGIVSNTAIGYSSMQANTTGDFNTAIGYLSMQANTTGYSNTSIGNRALFSNTTGYINTAVGSNALDDNTTGTYNSALGVASLLRNTTGSNNTAVGWSAGSTNTTGSNNTYIGQAAGGGITAGSFNTIIGQYTGTAGMSYNIVLADGAGNVRFRYDGTNNNLYGNVNFSSTIGNGTYTYTLPSATGTLALTSAIPANIITGTGTTNYHTKFTGTSTIGNSLIWDNGTNVGIGNTNTSYTLDVSGTGRFTGALTLNTPVGGVAQKIYAYTDGYGVIRYFTNASVAKWQTGIDNSNSYFIYNEATASNNLTITSAGNVGIGSSSPTIYGGGLEVSRASQAGVRVSSTGSGAGGVELGYSGGAAYIQTVTAGSDLQILTGAASVNAMSITSGGSVGIGNTNPFGTSLGFVTISASGTTYNILNVQDTVNQSGTVFQQFLNATNGVCGNIVRVGTTNAVVYGTTSDYRLKEDLKEIKGLEKVCAIKVYDFKWKDNEYRMDGVLAHELQEIIPFAVSGEKDDMNKDDSIKAQSVDYSKIVPALVKAIQESHQIIKDLEARIVTLEQK